MVMAVMMMMLADGRVVTEMKMMRIISILSWCAVMIIESSMAHGMRRKTYFLFADSVVQRSPRMSGAKADAELRSKTDNLERMITEVIFVIFVILVIGDICVGDWCLAIRDWCSVVGDIVGW